MRVLAQKLNTRAAATSSPYFLRYIPKRIFNNVSPEFSTILARNACKEGKRVYVLLRRRSFFKQKPHASAESLMLCLLSEERYRRVFDDL